MTMTSAINGTRTTIEGHEEFFHVPDERDENDIRARVFLRLRPMNKYEISRRSRKCVIPHPPDIHGTTRVTIDSPHEGEYDFEFDQVFDEDAKQGTIYEYLASPIIQNFMGGYNCAVCVCGQSGSGRSYTLLGKENAVNAHKTAVSNENLALNPIADKSEDTTPLNNSKDDDTEGIIQRFSKDIFSAIAGASDEIEFMLRCSYFEIYMEKVRDLLNPQWRPVKIIDGHPINRDAAHETRVHGVSEICCTCEDDVQSLVSRGKAFRTILQARQQTDIGRSHAIFCLKLEQRHIESGRIVRSCMQLIEMAANDLIVAPYQQENKLLNHSASALTNVMRALTEGKKERSLPESMNDVPYQTSTFTRIISNAFGGNCITALVCTASPASFNISETLSSVRFGQKCRDLRNRVFKNVFRSFDECIVMLEKKKRGTTIVSSSLENEARTSPAYSQIHNGCCDTDSEEIMKTRTELITLRKQLEEATARCDNMDNIILGIQSEAAVLRHENDTLIESKKKDTLDLIDAKNEVQDLRQKKLEIEHNLRTSQFRESEATLFLRQFRRFYKRLLQNKEAHGSRPMSELFVDSAGVPMLSDLVDIDRLLWQAGLLEEEDIMIEADKNRNYRPSCQALTRSSLAASSPEPPSHELVAQDRSFLELELRTVTNKCISLNVSLQEARSMVDLLSNNAGSLAKKRFAEEALSLRKVLEQKENDLQAIIWKMNELNLINKTYNKKLSDMEEHVKYMEQTLHVIQENHRTSLSSHRDVEKKLREDLLRSTSLVDSLTSPLSQQSRTGRRNLCSMLVSIERFGEESDLNIPFESIFQGNECVRCEETMVMSGDNLTVSEVATHVPIDHEQPNQIINDSQQVFDDRLRVLWEELTKLINIEFTDGKMSSYVPIRFTPKVGLKIRLGTLKDSLRFANRKSVI